MFDAASRIKLIPLFFGRIFFDFLRHVREIGALQKLLFIPKYLSFCQKIFIKESGINFIIILHNITKRDLFQSLSCGRRQTDLYKRTEF